MNYFQHWIQQRHQAHINRCSGLPAPWSPDPILQQFKFCNVYRQLDRTTQWLNDNWFIDIPYHVLPFWTVVARLLNHPEPLEAVRPLHWDQWDPRAFVAALEAVRARGGTVRGGAYIVSTNGTAQPLPQFLATHILTPLSRADTQPDHTLAATHARLMQYAGIGSFLAGQIIADLKHHHPALRRGGPNNAYDWFTFVAPGPGSKRGLNRLYGLPAKKGMTDSRFHDMFGRAVEQAEEVVWANKWPEIDAQNVQNCLCEYDKYERFRTGEGRPKQRFDGTENRVSTVSTRSEHK